MYVNILYICTVEGEINVAGFLDNFISKVGQLMASELYKVSLLDRGTPYII